MKPSIVAKHKHEEMPTEIRTPSDLAGVTVVRMLYARQDERRGTVFACVLIEAVSSCSMSTVSQQHAVRFLIR